MALRVIEGFDYYTSGADTLNRRGFLQWVGTPGWRSMMPGRYNSSGQSGEIYNSIGQGNLAANLSTFYFGCGVNTGTSISFTWSDSATGAQLTITLNTDGSISHNFGRTGNNVWPQTTWFYIEMGGVVSKTVGTFAIRINGQTVYSGTGLNTSPQTNQYVNSFAINSGAYGTLIDDIYICDGTTGPGEYPCNTFLGDRRISTLLVDAPGTSTQWTPFIGSSANWQMVTSADGDTTYNSSSTAGQEDLFYLSALPSDVIDVIGVQVSGQFRKTDATDHSLSMQLMSGSVDQQLTGFLAPYSLTNNYLYYTADPLTTDPNTSEAWTLAAMASGTVQIGYKLQT